MGGHAVQKSGSPVVRDGALVFAKIPSGSNPLTAIESLDLETGASNWQFMDDVAVSPALRVLFGDSVGDLRIPGGEEKKNGAQESETNREEKKDPAKPAASGQ